MNTASSNSPKQRAIEIHSLQAAEFAASYGDMSSDAYGSCFTYSRKRLDALMERYLPDQGDGLKALDIGCGTGHHMARLMRRGFDVAGVDGSPEMLAHARDNNPGARLECADVEQMPFGDGEFDYVICIEVLRYLPDISGLVREMARVLKPGGTALATAAPPLNLNGYWLVNRIASTYHVGGLVPLKQYFHSSRKLRNAFRESGFERPTIHGVYVGPVNWIEHAAPRALPDFLRRWERIDTRVADSPLLKEFSNMFLVRAARGK